MDFVLVEILKDSELTFKHQKPDYFIWTGTYSEWRSYVIDNKVSEIVLVINGDSIFQSKNKPSLQQKGLVYQKYEIFNQKFIVTAKQQIILDIQSKVFALGIKINQLFFGDLLGLLHLSEDKNEIVVGRSILKENTINGTIDIRKSEVPEYEQLLISTTSFFNQKNSKLKTSFINNGVLVNAISFLGNITSWGKHNKKKLLMLTVLLVIMGTVLVTKLDRKNEQKSQVLGEQQLEEQQLTLLKQSYTSITQWLSTYQLEKDQMLSVLVPEIVNKKASGIQLISIELFPEKPSDKFKQVEMSTYQKKAIIQGVYKKYATLSEWVKALPLLPYVKESKIEKLENIHGINHFTMIIVFE